MKDHADPHTDLDRIDSLVDDIDPVGVQHDGASIAVPGIQVVHAVQTAQKGRFPAAGRTNKRGGMSIGKAQRDGFERLSCPPVIEAQLLRFSFHGGCDVNLGRHVHQWIRRRKRARITMARPFIARVMTNKITPAAAALM